MMTEEILSESLRLFLDNEAKKIAEQYEHGVWNPIGLIDRALPPKAVSYLSCRISELCHLEVL